MPRFNLSGYYEYLGTLGELEGSLIADSEGRFEGEVLDYGSRVPRQKISGQVTQENGQTELGFYKYPSASDLANLLYRLQKNSPGIAGNYEGTWISLPRTLSLAIGARTADSVQPLVVQIQQNPVYVGGERTSITLTQTE